MRKGNSENESLVFLCVCVCVSFLPHFVSFYDNSEEAYTHTQRERMMIVEQCKSWCCIVVFLYLFNFFFWQFTTFIIITSVIYNYTLDSVVFFFFCSPHSISSENWFDVRFVMNEEQCWYWRNRRMRKKTELNSKKIKWEWIYFMCELNAHAFCR